MLYFFSIGKNIIYDGVIESDPNEEPFLEYDLRQRPDLTLDDYWRAKYKERLMELSKEIPEETPETERSAILEARSERIQAMERMIEFARNVLIEIVDEVSKGAESRLRIDHEATRKTGVEHITIKSLKDWFDTRDDSAEKPLEKLLSELMAEDQETFNSAKAPSEMSKSERSLYVTLAFCAETYAKKAGNRYLDGDGGFNAAQLAEAIREQAVANADGLAEFPSQSTASIRARLNLARDCKKYVQKG